MRVNVKALREQLGLNREDFGALLPVDKRTIRRWENGEAEPSPMAHQRLKAIREERAPADESAPVGTVVRRRMVLDEKSA